TALPLRGTCHSDAGPRRRCRANRGEAMKLHTGTLIAGVVCLVVGIAFGFEALDYWTLRLSDLRYIGPLALVVIGVTVLGGALTRRPPETGTDGLVRSSADRSLLRSVVE